MADPTPRVVATDAARELIDTLRAKHGPLMFHPVSYTHLTLPTNREV